MCKVVFFGGWGYDDNMPLSPEIMFGNCRRPRELEEGQDYAISPSYRYIGRNRRDRQRLSSSVTAEHLSVTEKNVGAVLRKLRTFLGLDPSGGESSPHQQ